MPSPDDATAPQPRGEAAGAPPPDGVAALPPPDEDLAVPPAGEPGSVPPPIPAEFVRYAVALEAPELAWGHLDGRLTAADTRTLAFLRRCDLGPGPGEAFARIHARGADPSPLAAVCREIVDGRAGAGGDAADPRRVWDHLELSHRLSRGDAAGGEASGRQLAAGRREFLLSRAASGRGMNWQDSSALLGTDRPEEVDAAFERGEELVGVAVIGLALTHPDATAVLPRVARALDRALASSDPRLRHQGVVALAHTARLHRTVDRRCLDLLRRCPRGGEADDDLWAYVPRRRLPWWLWRHRLGGPPRRWVRRIRRVLRGPRSGG
ncbi:hypothetical protein [Streptomyces lydicus]|uniref:Uncharacterized protein n=1 Tax=Streptomyces lydicus TaxID=47763 RepID=A0A1D7VPU3_9ACTN|nr:hypothetical protein [Streptomyces lydicus]AOP48769.1 hypothetical protein SL103_23215 [Streptomyces lydicus]